MGADRVTKIEKGVPFPASEKSLKGSEEYADFGRVAKKGPALKYPFRLMEVGDSVLIEAGEAKRAKEAARKTSYRYPAFRFRHITDSLTGDVRIWRVA